MYFVPIIFILNIFTVVWFSFLFLIKIDFAFYMSSLLIFFCALYLLHFTKLVFQIKLCRRWWRILDRLGSTELHENFRRKIENLFKYSKVFGVVLVCRNLTSDLINIWLTKEKKYEVQVLNYCCWVRHSIFWEIQKTQVWKSHEELAR